MTPDALAKVTVWLVAAGAAVVTGWISYAYVAQQPLRPEKITIGPAHAELPEPDPAILGVAPTFELTNQLGRPFSSAELEGKVWVASVFFSECTSVCPIMMRNLSELQKRIATLDRANQIEMVSFSADPLTDNAQVLQGYAEGYGADPQRWVLLTSLDRPSMWRLIEGGLKLPVQATPDDRMNPILHSTKLVLVDRQGRVRAYHDGIHEAGLDALMLDIKKLLAEPTPAADEAASAEPAASGGAPSGLPAAAREVPDA